MDKENPFKDSQGVFCKYTKNNNLRQLRISLADFILLFYTYNMHRKERLLTLFAILFFIFPLSSSINDLQMKKTADEKTLQNKLSQKQTAPETKYLKVFFPKADVEEGDQKLTKRQKELMKKREQALAEIEARKAAAESGENSENVENTDGVENAEISEQSEKSELAELPQTPVKSEEKDLKENQEDQEAIKAAQAAREAEEKRLREEAQAKAEAERAARLAAAQAQKLEQEKLQAQIEKELEKQKSASEKNKKEYLSDYMVYDFETINDSADELEASYNKISEPDERDAAGRTLLMRAAKEGNEWEIEQLLASGANVNLTDSDGWTALMYAVRYSGSLECVEKLIDAGSDVKTKNNYGFSALVLSASYNGNPKILARLLESYKASDKEVLRALVSLLSEQNISERQQLSKLQIFMDKAVPLNILYEGKTPLMYSAKYGNSTKVLQILLDNQSSVTLRSTEGKTAFDYALTNNNLAHNETYWALNKK